jgi:Hint domain-containing protein
MFLSMRVIFLKGVFMTATKEAFSFAYELTGTFPYSLSIVDDHPSSPYIDPVATGVTLRDSNGGSLESGDTADVSKVVLDWDPIFNKNDEFVFVGTATAPGQGSPVNGLLVEDQTTGRFFFLTNTQFNGGNGNLTITNGETSLCFMAGTLIRTPDGDVAVETLKRGDRVLTQDGRIATVDWLGIQTISMRFADKLRVQPIRIRAGAIAENVPSRDLLVSPDHAILVEGALIQAGALVNGTSIVRETNVPMTFKYYHVEVEDHSLILAENTPAETFVDNVERLAFDNWAEHEALYPDGKPITELPYPRAKSQRQVPVSTRVMLAARAEAIGATAATAAA